MGLFRFKACRKCRGDLVLDEGDWLCLQCGTYYYTGLYRRPGFSASGTGRRIGPESTGPSRDKALASEPTLVLHNEAGLRPLGPVIGRFAPGVVVGTETVTVARQL